jgi:pyrimidine deaminase RibD-like protein
MKNWVLARTIKVASSSTYGQFLHGAVIEKGGAIICDGINTVKGHTHAEAAAIDRANKANEDSTYGATLYTARITKSRIALGKPCDRCMMKIRSAGIKKVIYSIDNNTWGTIIL